MRPSFEEQLAAARKWEQRIVTECRRQGYYVVPSFDFCGKDGERAPAMVGPPGEARVVLPDIQLFREGKQIWLEVKTKTTWSFWNHGQYYETGFDLRHYLDYQRIEHETGIKTYVVFVHLEQREMRGDSLERLKNYESHKWEHMVYWRYDLIPRWGSVTPSGAASATHGVQMTQPFTESPLRPPRLRPAPVIGRLKPPVSTKPPSPPDVVGQTNFFAVLDAPRRRGGYRG